MGSSDPYPDATSRAAAELVEDLREAETRYAAYFALLEMGPEALPALRHGLEDRDWEVRRWSAMLLDGHADEDALRELVPLLRDPKAKVRLWAVHSISCDRCKGGENPIDVVPLLAERVELDESIRVRRMAVAMLGEGYAEDRRAVQVFERVLREERDRKLRLHAERGLERSRAPGCPRSDGPAAG